MSNELCVLGIVGIAAVVGIVGMVLRLKFRFRMGPRGGQFRSEPGDER